MAKGGGSRGRAGRPRRAGPAQPSKTKRDAAARPAAKKKAAADPAHIEAGPAMPARFVLGVIPGATPGRWVDTWRDRMPQTELELRPVAFATQREELLDGGMDAALVRLPLDADGLHVIPLYDESPVVVCSADSHLSAADELELDDLAGELLIVPRDDVLSPRIPGALAPSFDPPEDTEQAIATVAAGVGIVIVPMSLARLHRRKDAASRALRDGPVSTVALAWPADRTTAAVEAFVGIVRGRTANSSR